MKAVKKFLAFKVPDNKAYEKRAYSEEFYIMEAWRTKYRRLGVFLSASAFVILSATIQYPTNWVKRLDREISSGLWDMCYTIKPNVSMMKSEKYSDDNSYLYLSVTTEAPINLDTCHFNVQGWQKGVIGLLIFAVLFGSLGVILSFRAICASGLPKRIYYYHSSGEIFFVSAMATAVALILYPLSVEYNLQNIPHRYGYAYILAWLSCVLFFLGTLCMMLDEVIREFSQPVTCASSCLCFLKHSSPNYNLADRRDSGANGGPIPMSSIQCV